MSMTLYVILSLSDVPNTNALNNLAKQLNTPVYYVENVELKEHTGFLPVKLKTEDSGVETYMSPYSEFTDYFPNFDSSVYQKPVVITFRWGGDMNEMVIALNSAYLLGYEKQSAVFEPQSGIFLTNAQVKEGAEAVLGNGI